MDLIKRQAAIDAIRNQIIHTPEELSDCGMAYYDGLHCVISLISELPSAEPESIKLHVDHTLTEEEIKNLKQKIADSPIVFMPSSQPEIIRCKDCKWFGEIGCAISIVDDSDKPTEDDFCSFAERRTDE